MSQLNFDHGIVDPPPNVVVDFQTWLAGNLLRYQRRPCSCGCQDKQPTPLEFQFENPG